MLQYNNKNIDEMSLPELMAAKANLDDMGAKFQEKQNDPRYLKKMLNQPKPEPNPHFVNLKKEIETEIDKRKS